MTSQSPPRRIYRRPYCGGCGETMSVFTDHRGWAAACETPVCERFGDHRPLIVTTTDRETVYTLKAQAAR